MAALFRGSQAHSKYLALISKMHQMNFSKAEQQMGSTSL